MTRERGTGYLNPYLAQTGVVCHRVLEAKYVGAIGIVLAFVKMQEAAVKTWGGAQAWEEQAGWKKEPLRWGRKLTVR
jgi:hypothetical protein